MKTTDLTHELDNTIDWRREKAKQFPEDTRNLTAIEICERLKGDEVSPEIGSRIDALEQEYLDLGSDMGTLDSDLFVSHDETYRSIGFSFRPAHIDELVAALSRDYETAIQRLRDLAPEV